MPNATSHIIRPATAADATALLELIRGIAEYERLTHAVINTEAAILKNGFGPDPYFHALLCEAPGRERPVGFALYFFTYSTFTGKPSLYLEDLFVRPEERGSGFGKALFLELVRIAREKECGRMEWSVLNWNRPAIDFYLRMGAKPLDDWTVYRLDEAALAALAKPPA
ncbi:MAG TPA: GNAT family N-acetyltransferase [bacterium]|nr:GNAT family N-acetyltransferase [bacterium]HQG45270.1 GNAT family N-acetyltransferase [bacterium]HQI49019.1 GNAT family N-acetyltransferase [bacterium]HQJ63434.1 GNAT family N-acetyltransferase [bacterium]